MHICWNGKEYGHYTVINCIFFDKRQQWYEGTMHRTAPIVPGLIRWKRVHPGLVFRDSQNELHTAVRKLLVRIVTVMHGECNLLKIIGTVHSPCGFASSLDGGQQKSDQDANNGNDDKKFDKSESDSVVQFLRN